MGAYAYATVFVLSIVSIGTDITFYLKRRINLKGAAAWFALTMLTLALAAGFAGFTRTALLATISAVGMSFTWWGLVQQKAPQTRSPGRTTS